ncbi:hypothetical protein F3Y22_tig00111069pilonHSYRG00071 [Hibiscus syriacus]|uniref:Uncharacterized protein n=1 Tax=Hibiscus syriacus TaxID=106335 RepID=A0A6A2Z391_HIBSY|nr:uncharacterized protein LOC120151720 [Hibiscus syriacus]KAE8686328.1 hypothetical protein F3Y22_tig00111069pilonHSYRG00071 [Hibiscus syriacus]
MAEHIEDAEFWLPSMIFMDDDTLMEDQNLKNKNDGENNTESLTSSHGFPIEFPFEFDYPYDSFSAISSIPVESVVESTETERSDEEDEFLAGLTRRIVHSTSQKLAVRDLPLDKNEENGGSAGSPESTLNVLGNSSASSNGGSRVAEMKMSKDVPKNTIFKHGKNQPKIQNHGFVKNPSCGLPLNRIISSTIAQTNHYHGWQMNARTQQQQMKKNRLKSNIVGKRPLFQVRFQPPPLILMFLGGPKRESAGTGVFIPRKYDDKPSRSHKKSGKN